MLTGKTVLLCVTGSIAAYKMANVASMLVKLHAEVHVIMTRHATKFIHPITFETITAQKCLIDTFDRNFQFHVAHVSIAQKADIVLIAPATANVLAKLAYGLADDMLSTTVLATSAPKLVAPAMNVHMFQNKIVQRNISILKENGFCVIAPEAGRLACGEIGEGKLPKEDLLIAYILREIAYKKDLLGKKVLVTAGPTREEMDPVRFLTNHSTGKMGYAIAKMAMLRGAQVTLVTGPTALEQPPFITVIPVISAAEMFAAVKKESKEQDLIIKAAAVADYRPQERAEQKIKKQGQSLQLCLERTTDILEYLGKQKMPGQVLCGFCMETQHLAEAALEKRKRKNADLIVANQIGETGSGFASDTNQVQFVSETGTECLPRLSKEKVANQLLDRLLLLWNQKNL